MLIKDEPAENIIFGDTLGVKNAKDKGNGYTPHRSADAMLAHISDPLLDPARRLAALQADMEKRGIVLG